MYRKKIVVISLLLLLCVWVKGHEFWIQSKKYTFTVGETAVLDFVVGEEFKGDYWNLTKERIVKLEHRTAGQRNALSETIVEGRKGANLSVKLSNEGTHLIVFQSNNSFIEMEPAAFLEYLEEDGLDYIIKERAEANTSDKPSKEFYARCAKILLQAGEKTDDTFMQFAGMPLEIMPLQNPYTLKRGDEMRFQVLYNGQPVPNALVKVWNRKDGTTYLQNIYTENNGIMSTRVSNDGSWMISSVRMVKSEDAEADYQSYWASLVFGY